MSWFDSYLGNITQQVIFNRNESKADKVQYRVPQWLIIGSLLFLIFINDLLLTLKDFISSIDLYADDTTLYDIQFDKVQLENNLQHVLNLLHIWCLENGMLLNTDKQQQQQQQQQLMLITNRQKGNVMAYNNLTVNYNNIELQLTSSEKYWLLILKIISNGQIIFNKVSKKISSYFWQLSQIRSYLLVSNP